LNGLNKIEFKAASLGATSISINHDRNADLAAKTVSHNLQSDIKIPTFSIALKENVQYKSESNGDSTLNLAIENVKDQKKFELNAQSDCFTTEGKCKSLKGSFKQNFLPSLSSKIAPGKTIDLTSCNYDRSYERTKSSNSYLFDSSFSLACGGVQLMNNAIYFRYTFS
jgi:hypothetical protein